jgi:predicted DNA-binding transcriptional regulator AlpA
MKDEITTNGLIGAAEVRRIFGGVSDMWIWRRLEDGFLPQPVIIARRRYWRRQEIEALISKLASPAGEAA